jgi:Acyltransferase family.
MAEMLILWLVYGEGFNLLGTVTEIFTIKLHLWTTWYPKVQIALYIVFWIVMKASNKYGIAILFGLTLIYCIIFIVFGLDEFWWNSILCFPLGVLVAKYKNAIINRLKKIKVYAVLIPILLFFVAVYALYVLGISRILGVPSALLLCGFLIVFLFRFNIRSKILEFIGNASFEIYLWHLVFLDIYFKQKFITENMTIKIIVFYVSVICLSIITHRAINGIMGSKSLSLKRP